MFVFDITILHTEILFHLFLWFVVKIHPSELVLQGSDAHLTCSVSHLLPSINIMLLWVQMNATSSIPVKSRKLSIMQMENTLHVKNVNENRTDWTCLVFNNNFLVGFIQTKLNYTMKPNFKSTTSDYETEPSPGIVSVFFSFLYQLWIEIPL